MARSARLITRLLPILPLVLASVLPLRAQLDPKLQGATTDFLDLFQQSSQAKVKPEILTLFDFSGSMASLMCHPLYVNNDVNDVDEYRWMTFTLTPAGGGTLSNNNYTIKATPGNCSGAQATYVVNVSSGGQVTLVSQSNPKGCQPTNATTAPTFTITASAAGNSSAKATVTCTPVSTTTDHTNYTLTASNGSTAGTGASAYTITKITLSPASGPWTPTTVVTLTTTLTHPYSETDPASATQINWSINGGQSLTTPVYTVISQGVYQSVTTWSVYDFVSVPGGAGDPTQLRPITASPALPQNTGLPITFDTWFLTQGTGAKNNQITWTVSGPSPNNCSWTAPASVVTTATTSSSSGGFTWTPPAYCSTLSGTTAASVTAALDPRASSLPAKVVPGATYLTNTLTFKALIKPDGTVVTAADADKAITDPAASGLFGASLGQNDVRNWVRAASHVRFSVNVPKTPSGTDTRTVDVPIPWKITNRDSMMDYTGSTSTTSPLSSVVVRDQVVDNKVTYGSGNYIESDLNYKFSSGSSVLSGGSGKTTSTTLGGTAAAPVMVYRPAYISWLFNGKYTDGTYKGKYVVYDAANASLAGGQGNVSWGQGYGPSSGNWGTNLLVPQYSGVTGAYVNELNKDAVVNVVPALTRCQAVKSAAIRTWINYQSKVAWAFRFLDAPNESGAAGTNTTIDNNSKTTLSAADPTTTLTIGADSGWTLLNNTDSITSTTGNSVKGMSRIAALFPGNNTPLTYAMARAYAQFNDPNNVFNGLYSATNPVSQCLSHFLIVFTDGIDNNNTDTVNPKGTTPYINGTVFDANTGNGTILGTTSLIDRSGDDWNMFTFAGMAAHMADLSLTNSQAAANPGASAASATSPHAFLPFAIYKRNGTIFDRNHRITTMTVGVSLGGSYKTAGSPKSNLFLTAAVGDTSMSSWSDISTLTPFVPDPTANSGAGGKKSGSLYFFDASNPDELTTDLNFAILSALGASLVNVTSNPSLPFIGSSLGKEIYLGKFVPPSAGGVMWSGDLLMFPTKVDSTSKTVILDKSGNVATSFDASGAVWSAATALAGNRRWEARHLYTRIPNTTSLSSFTYKDAAFTNAANATPPGLMNYVATDNTTYYTPGGTNQQNLIKMVMGANLLDPTNTSPIIANRPNIMGDIINSSPAYLEYKWNDVSGRLSGTALDSSRSRFRLLLVGDNQGWLHAFGETTNIASVAPDLSQPTKKVDLVSGEVDELWAFMPTDFLANLDYLDTPGNAHKFMVDGSPTIYFLDLPASSGGVGNGVLDGSNIAINPFTDTTHERAIAIIGLRKGGRSYYALNLHDPLTPTLQWSLVPDEASTFDTNRNKTGLTDAALKAIIGNMGYSTSTPSIGRVLYGGVYTDVVFLGGGYSVPEIEAKFTGSPKLGRSVLAVEVNTGNILAAVDLTNANIGGTSIGPIATGVVPFEFFLGSGMAQRAYFLDFWGGLWCWGSKLAISSSDADYMPAYDRFRKDSSDLKLWTSSGTADTAIANTGIRKVYQDENSKVAAGVFSGPTYSTLPAPFLVNSFPGSGYTYGGKTTAVPAAVGIAMESGNRYDPLDFGTNKPANTRLTVVFDRQDSRAWGLDSASGPDTGISTDAQLLNAGKWGAGGGISSTISYGSASITPGNSNYYLSLGTTASTNNFGYYISFPDKQQDSINTSVYHYSKGINSPVVVAGSGYYSYFTPTTADVCTGGAGFTYSNVICDIMNPVASDSRTGLICTSGMVDKWVNVASDFSLLGAPGVQQAGTRAKANPNDATKQVTYMDTSTYLGSGQSRYPKARVWRTVH
jgi:hypothetical protein